MLKSSTVFILSLMMTFTLRCPTSSAEQINLKSKTCIDRAEEEKFVICWEQNTQCHEALRAAAKDAHTDLAPIAFSLLGGILAGIIIESHLRK